MIQTAWSNTQAAMTFVYALSFSPPPGSPGFPVWYSSGPMTPRRWKRSSAGSNSAIDANSRATSTMISAPCSVSQPRSWVASKYCQAL